MSCDCKLCKNEALCKSASKTGELVKCKFEILDEQCEQYSQKFEEFLKEITVKRGGVE